MVDIIGIISFSILFVGMLMLVGALLARRGGRFRNRQAEVLAGAAAVAGALMLAVGLYAAIKA